MGFSPGISTISGLSDVFLNNPATGEFFGFTNGTNVWQNKSMVGFAALPVGGGQETIVAANSTTTTTLALANGNVFNITLVGNTTLAFTGATNNKACAVSVYLTQDGSGNHTVGFPGSVKWAGGTEPTVTATAGATDILVFESLDGGTTWFGSLVGANFS
jgi:predicted secreted protein